MEYKVFNRFRWCTVEDYDTPHPHMVWYRALLLAEYEDGHRVWHWFRHPFTRWIPKNSMAWRVKVDR